MTTLSPPPAASPVPKWAKVIDHTRCIGCHACSTACKSENEVPLGVHRTYVKYVDVGTFPDARRAFQVTRCNQCEVPPCAIACPTAAMYKRPDGIVDFDKTICIGCKACIAACPYDAIFINPDDSSAEKCNFCAHRLDVGLEPACVVVCPTEAILVGDMGDRETKVGHTVGRDVVSVRRPEKETRPKLFYKGAHQATLDPLAAKRPDGGLFMWAEQQNGDLVTSGHPGTPNNAAAALLSYDVGHDRPWGWKVSLYTVTKGIAAGAYLLPALLQVTGQLGAGNNLFHWVAPLFSLVFLGITGALLIWDLKKPQLFLLIFKRPQWKSWLVRGAFIIAGFSVVLVAHLLAMLVGLPGVAEVLAWPGIVLAALTAVYTAFLFAQCKARDLWQSSLLLPQLLFQAMLAGAVAIAPWAALYRDGRYAETTWTALAILSVLHLLGVAGEVLIHHPTEHASLAAREMTRGQFAGFFWVGLVLLVAGCFAPVIGMLSVPCILIGLLAYEHAYVQGAQSVPIA